MSLNISLQRLDALNIAILQTGRTPEPLKGEHGDYDDMCKALVGRRPHQAESFAILDHEFPNDIEAYDLLIITGSAHGVYEGHDWIAPLEDIIRKAYAKHVKLLGLCFGHQIIAQALGGTVVKSDKGLGVGVMDYHFTDDAQSPSRVSLCAWHQDQVISPPKDAKTILTSDFCPYAGLEYGDRVLSFQPHPEFSKAFVQSLINLRRTTTLDENTARKSEKSLQTNIQPHIIQDMIAAFCTGTS